MICKCGAEFRPLTKKQLQCRQCQLIYNTNYQRKYRRGCSDDEWLKRKKVDMQYKKLYALTQVQSRIVIQYDTVTETLKAMARKSLRKT